MTKEGIQGLAIAARHHSRDLWGWLENHAEHLPLRWHVSTHADCNGIMDERVHLVFDSQEQASRFCRDRLGPCEASDPNFPSYYRCKYPHLDILCHFDFQLTKTA